MKCISGQKKVLAYTNYQHCIIWDALRDLVPVVQFKKREKHSYMDIFSRFLNCTNGTKLRKASL